MSYTTGDPGWDRELADEERHLSSLIDQGFYDEWIDSDDY